MLAKCVLNLALLCALACSGGVTQHDSPESDEPLIVPAGVIVSARPATNSAFGVVALTLREGASGAELFAAVRNDGKVPACNPSFSVELLDQDQQTLALGISGLMMQHFYRLTDGSRTIAGCAAPGEVTMVSITNLSLDTALADVRQVVYSSSYWLLDVAAIDGIRVTEVRPALSSTGVAYTGVLSNGLDVPLGNPSVAIFPLTSVGRPLGVAFGSGTALVPPGGSWRFETNTVSDPGADYAAFPTTSP
jgi:hypothetical protein